MIPMLLLAQSAPDGWAVVNALSVLAALALASFAFVRQVSGKGGERQIEPTSLHAITSELKAQTLTLAKLDREMGETKAGIKAVDDKISAQTQQVENAFRRINAISIESAAVKARVDGLEHREGKNNA